MEAESIEKQLADTIAIAEKFPAIYRTVIVQELVRWRFQADHGETPGRGRRRVPAQRRPTIKSERKERNGPRNQLVSLADQGIFEKPKTAQQVLDALETAGFHYPKDSVRGRLLELVQDRRLSRVKIREGKRQVFAYVNREPIA